MAEVTPPPPSHPEIPDQEAPEVPSRRPLLGLLTFGLGAIPFAGGAFVAIRAGLASAKSEKPERLPLCKLSEVPKNGILEKAINFKMRRGPSVESVSRVVFVSRDKEGTIFCMAGECTHLTCPVQKRDVSLSAGGTAPLACPCHGGKFSATGEPLEGPPKRPLRRLKLEVPSDQKPDSMIYLLEV